MMMTLRKRSGVRFILPDAENCETRRHGGRSPRRRVSDITASLLTLDRRGDDDRDPDHYRADHDSERGVVIFLDLFLDRIDHTQNPVGDGEDHDADKDKD